MPQIEADLISTIRSFSRAGDLTNLTFLAHAERVAHISFHLGEKLGLDDSALNELTQSALLHDIGVMTDAEQLELADLEPVRDIVSPHCQRGYKLLKSTTLFGSLADNILEHHDFYSPQLRMIPAIIHLADRIDILLNKERYILWQLDDLMDYFFSKAGFVFSPDVVDALHALSSVPSFWLDLENNNYRFSSEDNHSSKTLTLDELEELAWIMALLVDSKSSFTMDHSQGVSIVAELMAQKLHFSQKRTRLIKVAALTHDIGKLAIPDEILLHPGALNRQQRAVMKQHTYHTYHLLASIGPGAQHLAGWAAFHHERLNGTGYPFALQAKDLDLEARLMAVADITQSLLEDRPYRPGLSPKKVVEILHNNVRPGHIDPTLTDLAIAHLDEIVELLDRHENQASKLALIS